MQDRGIVHFTGGGADAPGLAELIETMQRNAYEDAPWLYAQLDVSQARASIEDIERRYRAHYSTLPRAMDEIFNPSDANPMPKQSPSRLQDPVAYSGMRLLWMHVDDVARRRGIGLTQPPLLATLPTGEVNARAIRIDTTGELGLVFDDEIRVLAYLLGKIVAAVITVQHADGEDAVDVDLNRTRDAKVNSEEATLWFAALLDEYFRTGWIRTLPCWTLPPAEHRVALLLCTGFEHFVMGHEYGHLARNHLEGAYHATLDEYPEARQIMKGRAQEIEADAFGLTVACDDAVLQFGSPLPGFWGAYLACKAFELIDRGLYAVVKNCDWNPLKAEVNAWMDRTFDHPAPAVRGDMLRQMLRDEALSAEAENFIQAIDALFETMFTAALPKLFASRNRGIHKRFHTKAATFAYNAPGPKPFDL